MMLAARE